MQNVTVFANSAIQAKSLVDDQFGGTAEDGDEGVRRAYPAGARVLRREGFARGLRR